MLLEPRPCLFCLNPTTSCIKLTVHKRPWLHCVACGSRSFVQSFTPGLNGIALLTPFVHVILEQMQTREGQEVHSRRIAAFLDGIKAQVRGGEGLAPGASPAVAAPGLVLPVSAPPFARTA